MDPGHVKEKEEEEERVGEGEEEEEEITASTLRAKPRCLPISAVPAFSYIPPRRQDPKEHSYFQRESQVSESPRKEGRGGDLTTGEGLEAAGGRDGGGASGLGRGLGRGCIAGVVPIVMGPGFRNSVTLWPEGWD